MFPVVYFITFKTGNQRQGILKKVAAYITLSLYVLLSGDLRIPELMAQTQGSEFSLHNTDTLSPRIAIGQKIIETGFFSYKSYGFDLNQKLIPADERAALSQSSKTLKGQRREFYLPENFLDKIDQSARVFLPYTKILKAVNILLAHKKISNVQKIEINFEGTDDSAKLRKGVLKLSFQSPEQLTTEEVLRVFRRDLGWDFKDAIKDITFKYKYLLLDSDDFEAINLIIHSRLAGLGDLVFIGNLGQVYAKLFPGKTIRLLFHTNEDFRLVCQTKILKGLDPDKAWQKTGGMEVINAELYGKEKFGAKKMAFGIESEPWYVAQDKIISENDVSIVYALGGTPKEVMQNSHILRMYAGKSKSAIFVHELGFESLSRDPLSEGNAHLGFGDDDIGMPPVSPISESIYARKYPRVDEKIRQERRRIIEKFMGWDQLNSILEQKDLDKTIDSEWGFLYAHNNSSVKRYFSAFERAREKNPDFREETTFFVMCGKNDKGVIDVVKANAKANDYNLFVYNTSGAGNLECMHQARNNNVTIIIDYSVPRKLFSELFLYSDDLPTLVSGQDNLANILYLNMLTSGRPFLWEVLVFQATAQLDMLSFIKKQGRDEEADFLQRLWVTHGEVNDDQAEMFSSPRKYRVFFKNIATLLEKHKSLIPQMYYLMLRQVGKHKFSYKNIAESLWESVKDPVEIKVTIKKEVQANSLLLEQSI